MLDGIIRTHIILWVRFLFIVAHVIIPHNGSSKEMESNFEIKISLYISGTNTTLTIYVIHFYRYNYNYVRVMSSYKHWQTEKMIFYKIVH